MNLPDPVFFETDENKIIEETIAHYENETGAKLAPGQAERLLVNGLAYREKMLRVAGNEAGKRMLLAFASYPEIDYLGDFVGVTRLPASSAECTIIFSLVPGHPPLTIPAGVKIQSTDGKVVFATIAEVIAGSTAATVSVLAECTVGGIPGNGYKVGDISIILDPQAYVSAASNNAVTTGGSDQETDDAMRERIRLAPSSFSVAGPIDAYKYFVKSAHPSIIDVGFDSAIPGHVDIYPLLEGGLQPSQEVINAVLAKCSPEKVRPMNDIVGVFVPGKVDYSIEVELTLYKDAIASALLPLINKAIADYIDYRQTNLGVDIVIDQIKGRCMVEGVYTANVKSPSATILISKTEYANCTGVNINVLGESDY